MIGAPDVDHVGKATIELVPVIGDVGSEIGIGAIGLRQRPIDIVAIGGRAKQCLLAVFVILDRRPLRRRQATFIDVALRTKIIDGFGDAVISAIDQRPFRKEDIVLDIERGEIALDLVHHHHDGLAAR